MKLYWEKSYPQFLSTYDNKYDYFRENVKK